MLSHVNWLQVLPVQPDWQVQFPGATQVFGIQLVIEEQSGLWQELPDLFERNDFVK